MDLRRLSNFVQIVDAGSLTRAAKIIGVAQPALSFQIARLEEELGCRLLVRSTRGVQPTEEGMILYREARAIIRRLQQVPQLLRIPAADPVGDVAIGFPSSLAPIFSTSIVAAVRERYPRIKLQVFEGESTLQRELVMKNRVELALLCEHVPAGELYHRPLFRQRLALLCDGRDSNDHPGQPIDLIEAASRIVGLPSVGNPVRAVFDEAARRLGLTVATRVELNSMPTLIGAVERGLGATINLWIPFKTTYDGRAVVFRPIVNPDLWVAVSLCRSKSNEPSSAALLVEDIVVRVITERISKADWAGALPQDPSDKAGL